MGDVGRGGRSPLIDDDELELEGRLVEMEVVEVSARPEPFISHVKGGPETLIELLARPTVRPACRTVPKSHKSSGSPLAGLYVKHETVSRIEMGLVSECGVQVLGHGLFVFFESFSPFGFPPLVAFDQFREVVGLLGHPHKLVFEEFAGCWTLLNPGLHKDTR